MLLGVEQGLQKGMQEVYNIMAKSGVLGKVQQTSSVVEETSQVKKTETALVSQKKAEKKPSGVSVANPFRKLDEEIPSHIYPNVLVNTYGDLSPGQLDGDESLSAFVDKTAQVLEMGEREDTLLDTDESDSAPAKGLEMPDHAVDPLGGLEVKALVALDKLDTPPLRDRLRAQGQQPRIGQRFVKIGQEKTTADASQHDQVYELSDEDSPAKQLGSLIYIHTCTCFITIYNIPIDLSNYVRFVEKKKKPESTSACKANTSTKKK